MTNSAIAEASASTDFVPQKATVYERHRQESFSSTSTVPESWDSIRSNDSSRPGCLKRKSQEESIKCQYASMNKSTHAVKWSTVHVYCHTYELGDNPCPLLGPPITIAWKSHKELENMSVDDFETKHRGTTSRGMLSGDVREYILLNAGYSKRDLSRAINDARRVRMRRERTQHDNVDDDGKKGLFSFWGKKKATPSAKKKKQPKTVEFKGPEETYTVKVR